MSNEQSLALVHKLEPGTRAHSASEDMSKFITSCTLDMKYVGGVHRQQSGTVQGEANERQPAICIIEGHLVTPYALTSSHCACLVSLISICMRRVNRDSVDEF